MPRKCSICQHHALEDINKMLIEGRSLSDIVSLFPVLTKSAVHRHGESHLPATMAQAREAAEVAHADSIIERLKNLSLETMGIFREVKKAKDFDLALKAITRLEKQEELKAKLLGQLQPEGVVNVILAPEWLELRGVILQVLGPYPEARMRLTEALQEAENNATAK